MNHRKMASLNRLTSEWVNSNFLPNFELLLDVLSPNALHAQIGERCRHRLVVHLDRANAPLALFADQRMRMHPVWRKFGTSFHIHCRAQRPRADSGTVKIKIAIIAYRCGSSSVTQDTTTYALPE